MIITRSTRGWEIPSGIFVGGDACFSLDNKFSFFCFSHYFCPGNNSNCLVALAVNQGQTPFAIMQFLDVAFGKNSQT